MNKNLKINIIFSLLSKFNRIRSYLKLNQIKKIKINNRLDFIHLHQIEKYIDKKKTNNEA